MKDLESLLLTREDFLRVVLVKGSYGNVDIALVIDGGYGPEDAARVAVDYERQLREGLKALAERERGAA